MLKRLLLAVVYSRSVRAAESSYRRASISREQGRLDDAIAAYQEAVAIDPEFAAAWNDLGVAMCGCRDIQGARSAFSRAIAIEPDLVQARINLGQLLHQEFSEFRAASAQFQAVLDLEPGNSQARNGLGLALYECGDVGAALACLRVAIDREPGNSDAHQSWLFISNAQAKRDLHRCFLEHVSWAKRYADGIPWLSHERHRSARIRVGYVSGDFRRHATSAFIEPILEHHDRARFDVYCYQAVAEADEVTARMRANAENWREIHAISDEAAAENIRRDRIDVLVDLSGHTRGNRLGVFAYKPAPMQLSFLGYLNTTGMRAIEFRISDAVSDPPQTSAALHSERLIYLPRTQWCYRPPEEAPAPSPLAGRPVTFGSFNHIAKLNDRVTSVWGRLLARLPQARLLMLGMPDRIAGERILCALEGAGAVRDRVELLPRLPREGYWAALGRADIALDPFPYNGGATTCDSLWMGMPVVTLAGSFGFARSSASILGAAGLPDLIAGSEDEYVEKAAAIALDLARRADLRATTRRRMLDSPLMDVTGFVAAFEQAIEQAWSSAGGNA